MSNGFSPEMAKPFWKLMYFLETLFNVMNEDDNYKLPDSRVLWYGIKNDNDGRIGGVFFEVKRHWQVGISNYPLSITLGVEEEEFSKGLPVWIVVGRPDEKELWNCLKQEFPEDTCDEESWAVGLHLPFSGESSDEEVEDYAKKVAEKVLTALRNSEDATRAAWGIQDGDNAEEVGDNAEEV